MAWVAKFPTSVKTSDLKNPFRANFESFQKAMKESGISVKISASLRPKQRAYLMHYSWMIVKGKIDPEDVPPMSGVDIIWNHSNAEHGAREMVDGYGIDALGVAPALNSRHIEGCAVDTILSWNGDIQIRQKDGLMKAILGSPRNATHPDLIAVAATFGVIHFRPIASDKVHWSDNGH
jgi:hypothetical protein